MPSLTLLRRRLLRLLAALLTLVLLAAAGLVVWSRTGVMDAETAPWQEVQEDSRIAEERTDIALVLRPSEPEPARTGLLFYPGAKVEPEAYAARLSGLVTELGVTVVIVDPPLNLSLFDRRAPERFTSIAPELETWLVGGHSMGGVRACELAEESDALVLFASYCAGDLTTSQVPVLSLSGSEDGLSTPEKIAEHGEALPGSAEMVEIAGASHASFGDYGPQSGDGTPTIDDAEMDAAVEDAVAELLDTMP